MESLIVFFSSSFGIIKEKHHATLRELRPVYTEVVDPRYRGEVIRLGGVTRLSI